MKKAVLLELLDEERRLAGSQDSNGIVRELSADHSECRILYGPSIDDGLIEIIRLEQSKARAERYFTAVVASRLCEAAASGASYVFVDALPASEVLLRKLNFNLVTRTRPFTFVP